MANNINVQFSEKENTHIDFVDVPNVVNVEISSVPGASSGGTGTPAGSSTNVQFNNNGTFGGDSGFIYNSSGSRVTINGPVSTGAVLQVGSLLGVDPTTLSNLTTFTITEQTSPPGNFPVDGYVYINAYSFKYAADGTRVWHYNNQSVQLSEFSTNNSSYTVNYNIPEGCDGVGFHIYRAWTIAPEEGAIIVTSGTSFTDDGTYPLDATLGTEILYADNISPYYPLTVKIDGTLAADRYDIGSSDGEIPYAGADGNLALHTRLRTTDDMFTTRLILGKQTEVGAKRGTQLNLYSDRDTTIYISGGSAYSAERGNAGISFFSWAPGVYNSSFYAGLNRSTDVNSFIIVNSNQSLTNPALAISGSLGGTTGYLGVGTTTPAAPFDINRATTIRYPLTTTVSTGSAPFIVSSTTLNTNLNADLLDGLHANQIGLPAGSDTQVQFNTNGSFDASGSLVFLKSGGHLTSSRIKILHDELITSVTSPTWYTDADILVYGNYGGNYQPGSIINSVSLYSYKTAADGTKLYSTGAIQYTNINIVFPNTTLFFYLVNIPSGCDGYKALLTYGGSSYGRYFTAPGNYFDYNNGTFGWILNDTDVSNKGPYSITALTNLGASKLDGTITTGSPFVSTVSTGSAPFSVSSTTLNTNLNADLLDGQHGSFYLPTGSVLGSPGQVAFFNGSNSITSEAAFTYNDTNNQLSITSSTGSSPVKILARSNGGTGTYGALEWWSENGTNRLGILSGDSATNPTYGAFNLIGRSASNTRLSEFNTLNDTYVGDKRACVLSTTYASSTVTTKFEQAPSAGTFKTPLSMTSDSSGGRVGINNTSPSGAVSITGRAVAFEPTLELTPGAGQNPRIKFNTADLVVNRGTASLNMFWGETTDTGNVYFRGDSGRYVFGGNAGAEYGRSTFIDVINDSNIPTAAFVGDGTNTEPQFRIINDVDTVNYYWDHFVDSTADYTITAPQTYVLSTPTNATTTIYYAEQPTINSSASINYYSSYYEYYAYGYSHDLITQAFTSMANGGVLNSEQTQYSSYYGYLVDDSSTANYDIYWYGGTFSTSPTGVYFLKYDSGAGYNFNYQYTAYGVSDSSLSDIGPSMFTSVCSTPVANGYDMYNTYTIYYKVYATDYSGNWSLPLQIIATNSYYNSLTGTWGPSIGWDAVTGATTYRIMRSLDGGTTYDAYLDTANNFLDDNNVGWAVGTEPTPIPTINTYLNIFSKNYILTDSTVQISNDNIGATLGTDTSHLILNNTSATGQIMQTFTVLGTAVGGIRGDYQGNFNWHATGPQGHQFYTSLDTSSCQGAFGGLGLLVQNSTGTGTVASRGTLDIRGSFATATSIVNTNTTLNEIHQIVIVSNNSIITLPSAVGITGRQYNIIRSGTSNVTINTTSSQTISGDSSLILTNQWDSVVVVSDGSNWVRCS